MDNWPVDPLLDEVDEARRRIMARHGNDWRKVLEAYVELDKNIPDHFLRAPRSAEKTSLPEQV